MQTTGIFVVHEFKISVDKLNEPIYLIPFGDIHRSSPSCHKEKWFEFLTWAKKKKRCYFLGMGDYDDLASASERKILANRDLHDSSLQTFENLYLDNTKRLYNEIKFMEGRTIGLIEGNHYGEFQNNTTTTQKLAEFLKCKYLGCATFIRLSFKFGNNHTASIDIWAHHGKGAARLIGGSLNRVQQMAESAVADIYLMGHDHKKASAPGNRLFLSKSKDGVKMHHKKQLYVRTGSFLRGYGDGEVSYVADMALNPTDLGVVKIELTPKRDQRDGDRFYIDVHSSI